MMDTSSLGAGPKLKPTMKGTLRPIKDRVLAYDMNFGERTTKGGIIITSDDGPKLNEVPLNEVDFPYNFCANNKYPLSGSKTCCHGLVAIGFLKKTLSFFDQLLTVSGTIRSCAQSPPPITLPALTVHIPKSFLSFVKKVL